MTRATTSTEGGDEFDEDIVAIGLDLIAVKEKLEHGLFGQWLAAEFEMSDVTAHRFMSVASRMGKSFTVKDLSPTVLYALAAPSTPDEVVEKATTKAVAGGKVTAADVAAWKAEIAAAKAATVQAVADASADAAAAKEAEFAAERRRLEAAMATAARQLEEARGQADIARRHAEVEAEKKYKGKADKMVEAAMTAKQRELGEVDREVKSREQSIANLKRKMDELEASAQERAAHLNKMQDQFAEERDLIEVMQGAGNQLGIVLAAFDARYQETYSEDFQGKVRGFLAALDRVRAAVAECGAGTLELRVVEDA